MAAEGPDWIQILGRLTDAHCHPNDAFHGKDIPRVAHQIGLSAIGQVCVMSSSLQSQSKTEELFHLQPKKVVPAFGLHPWYTATISTDGNLDKLSHYSNVLYRKKSKKKNTDASSHEQLSQETDEHDTVREIHEWVLAHLEYLPNPIKLDVFLSDLKARLCKYPSSIIGEIGLDKAFKFYLDLSSSASTQQQQQEVTDDKETNILKTEFKISMDHQLLILKSQIELAVELSRPISLHCVQAPNELLNLFQILKGQLGLRFTGIPIPDSSSSRKKKLNKQSTAYKLVEQEKSQLDSEDHGEEESEIKPRHRFKICWHSSNISVEILQRSIKMLPNLMYFSYSNDLAMLFEACKGLENLTLLKELDWNKYYSRRISDSVRATPSDRLLIESDHGSDPASIDPKLILVLRWISFLQRSDNHDPSTGPPEQGLDQLVAQIHQNWNQFYSFIPPPS